MDTIAIEGIQLHAFHGVYAKEREKGHTFTIDIYLGTHVRQAVDSDALQDTIDYAQIYNLVLEVSKEPVNLLEKLAYEILRKIFTNFDSVRQIRIKVSKLHPMTMNLCDRTFVEIERQRSEVI